jgi:hypothetical protein
MEVADKGSHIDGSDLTNMFFIVVAMLLVMALAGLVAAFVAYPDRGQPIPHAAWLSDRMAKLRDRLDP